MEAARRVAALLEAISVPHFQKHSLVTSLQKVQEMDEVLVPLSLAVAGLGPQTSTGELVAESVPVSTPARLASGLTPSPMLEEDATNWPISRLRSIQQRTLGSTDAVSQFRHLVLREECGFGGQILLGVIPECTTVTELRELCGSILEMICALLYQFCAAMQGPGGSEYGGPAATAAHSLISLVHELKSMPVLADLDELDFIAQLHRVLDNRQNQAEASDSVFQSSMG